MLSRTRTMLAELDAVVDALCERQWRPSDAALADTIYTLGDAIVEVDRILLELHKELVRRESSRDDAPTAVPPAESPG
jgi:hypothetical protein